MHESIEFRELEGIVFPSHQRTIFSAFNPEEDEYNGGAHHYCLNHCAGHGANDTVYLFSEQCIQFIHVREDGKVIPGIQDEQLLLVMIDRMNRLNDRFPSKYYVEIMTGLEQAREGMEKRKRERLHDEKLGKLKP